MAPLGPFLSSNAIDSNKIGLNNEVVSDENIYKIGLTMKFVMNVSDDCKICLS